MKTFKVSGNVPFPELRGSIDHIQYPALVEIKKDGEFEFVHVEKGFSFTINKEGKIRQEFNYLDAIEAQVLAKGYSSATFLAELTIQDGKAGALYELLANKENNELKLFVFDILEINGNDLRNFILLERKELLQELLPNSGNHAHIVSNKTQAIEAFQRCVDAGYEGVVVKSLTGKLVLASCDWVKIKYKDRNDYKVHMIDSTQERLEILVPTTTTNLTSKDIYVGVKCLNKYKKYINAGDTVEIEHQGILPSGSLRHPTLIAKPEWK